MTPNSKTPLEPSARSPLSVAYLPLDRVRPDPGNARRHSEKQIRQIARSIETFGFNSPELLNAAERCNDEPPILAAGPSVSRAGDLWRLGPHKLLCGDAECADCDVIVRRWQAHTGALARHEASGVLFEEMAQRRR